MLWRRTRHHEWFGTLQAVNLLVPSGDPLLHQAMGMGPARTPESEVRMRSMPSAGPAMAVEEGEILDLLTHLVEKSLVVYDEATGRYELLETVRQYARDRLLESGEGYALRSRCRDEFLALAERAEPHHFGPDCAEWLERLEVEHDNLRAALAWSLDEDGDYGTEASLRLVAALWRFWRTRGYLSEGRAYTSTALDRAPCPPGQTTARADVLHAAAELARSQDEVSLGNAYDTESLALSREAGHERGMALALNGLAIGAVSRGDSGLARTLFEDSLSIHRKRDDKWGIALALNNLAHVERLEGTEGVRPLLEESAGILRELGAKDTMALVLGNLGEASLKSGDVVAARTYYLECLTLCRELRQKWVAAYAVEGLAAASPRADRSATLYGAATALQGSIGVDLGSNARAEREANLAALRVELGEAAFDAAFDTGHALSWEQALDYSIEADSLPR